MLSEEQVSAIIKKVDKDSNQYPGMTYEEGVIDALQAVLEETDLEEFLEQFETDE